MSHIPIPRGPNGEVRVSDFATHMGIKDGAYARAYLRQLGATVFKVDGVWWAKLSDVERSPE